MNFEYTVGLEVPNYLSSDWTDYREYTVIAKSLNDAERIINERVFGGITYTKQISSIPSEIEQGVITLIKSEEMLFKN